MHTLRSLDTSSGHRPSHGGGNSGSWVPEAAGLGLSPDLVALWRGQGSEALVSVHPAGTSNADKGCQNLSDACRK